jgi:ankyrin repeat protein
LHQAAINQDTEMVNLILVHPSAGQILAIQNSYGNTALDQAGFYRNTVINELLLNYNIVDYYLHTVGRCQFKCVSLNYHILHLDPNNIKNWLKA